jgi:hypothetical protein
MVRANSDSRVWENGLFCVAHTQYRHYWHSRRAASRAVAPDRRAGDGGRVGPEHQPPWALVIGAEYGACLGWRESSAPADAVRACAVDTDGRGRGDDEPRRGARIARARRVAARLRDIRQHVGTGSTLRTHSRYGSPANLRANGPWCLRVRFRN